ncbi:MAG: hypothetical protein JRK53_14730 [Deltaproteobacteria bacterium]|nr:hypothetical protein [Deltaproteobacteria bacterium]
MKQHLSGFRNSGMLAVRALVPAVAALLIMGCGGYGKIRNSDVTKDQVSRFVDNNYPNLNAYYSGTMEKPGAILMDLKNTSPRFSGKKWYPIKGRQELLQMMDLMVDVYYKKMRGNAGTFGPLLQLVLGRNNKLIGYFYSPIDNWPVRLKGSGYSVDAVTYSQVREWSMGDIRSPSRKGGGGR